jgi:hypothetical protein
MKKKLNRRIDQILSKPSVPVNVRPKNAAQ